MAGLILATIAMMLFVLAGGTGEFPNRGRAVDAETLALYYLAWACVPITVLAAAMVVLRRAEIAGVLVAVVLVSYVRWVINLIERQPPMAFFAPLFLGSSIIYAILTGYLFIQALRMYLPRYVSWLAQPGGRPARGLLLAAVVLVSLLVELGALAGVFVASEWLIPEGARPVYYLAPPSGWRPSYDPEARPTDVTVLGAAPGGTASVSLHTIPGALCQIEYLPPQGGGGRFLAVGEWKRADPDGTVSWTWTIAPDTPPGSGVVTVACEGMAFQTRVAIQ